MLGPKVRWMLAVAALVVVAAGCGDGDGGGEPVAVGASSGDAAPEVTTTTPPPTLEGIDFTDFTYPGSTCRAEDTGLPEPPTAIAVTDGRSESWSDDFPAALSVFEVARGDLTADGTDEAAIWVECGGGASIRHQHVVVYQALLGGPRGLGTITRPDDLPGAFHYSEISSVAVEDGEVVVEWKVFTEDDAHCCPSATSTYRYRWSGSSFEVVDGPTPPAPIV